MTIHHHHDDAAPAIAPVREEASGSVQMRVINRRQHCYSAARVQGHYGRRFSVRKHSMPEAKTPNNAVYHSDRGCIIATPALVKRRVAVRSGALVKHTTPVKAPVNAVFHSDENSIMVERALKRERAAVRSGSSIDNRPFLFRPPTGKSSLYGEFCGRAGHQRVSQLYSCGPTAKGLSINIMLWGMETQLCTDKVDG